MWLDSEKLLLTIIKKLIMVEVKLNNSNNNPFYGLKECLKLLQSVGGTITSEMLNRAYAEVKDSKEKKQMFFSLLFSIGDITARQHNIFKGIKKDNGGNANREGFSVVFDWLKSNHKEQFLAFLNKGLFNEYACFDLLFRSRVQTKGAKVIKVQDIFADKWYCDHLADYVYAIINGSNPFNKMLVAKFLTPPRLSKRAGHKKMLEDTRKVMENKARFLQKLSALMGWEYSVKGVYANFKGYREWRKAYNGTLESVLFSTNKINEFDRTQFIDWLDKLPAQARFRVKNRVLYSKVKDTETLKWPKLEGWYKEWEKYKESKQAEQRVLEEKVKQGQATNDDVAQLEKVKKEAKVTTGATSFTELFNGIMNNSVDGLKLESFVQNKVNLPYNSLVIIDGSGSMNGQPFDFACFMAAVCLVKNPDDDGRNLLGMFSNDTKWYSYINREAYQYNSIMRRVVGKTVQKPFVDPTKSFMGNYKQIKAFCHAMFEGGWTNIASLIRSIKTVLKNMPQLVDTLKQYPVWTVISDGEWNQLPSPEASINDLLTQCNDVLGFKPYIVAIDVAPERYLNAERFSGIENLMYLPANPVLIEQFLTNFKDMDVFNVYTPLQGIFRSNRYDLVREATL